MRAFDGCPLRRGACYLAVAVACGIGGTAATPATAQQEGPVETPPPMLSPGDMVRMEVWRREELSGEFPVLGDGGIGHPLYKDIAVVGLPLDTVEARLRTYLSTLEADPQFTFVPLMRVAIAGEVGSPDLHHLPPETTIVEAVWSAGGPTESARTDDIVLRRGVYERRFDLHDPTGGGVRVQVRSGDEIIVGRRSDFRFVRDFLMPILTITNTVLIIWDRIDR